MSAKEIMIGLVGSGGDGVVAACETLLTSAALDGLYGRMTKSFGPQIRGGESSCRLHIGVAPVLSTDDDLDVLVVFNWDDYRRFPGELNVAAKGLVIADPGERKGFAGERPPVTGPWEGALLELPLEKAARETAGTPLAKNLVALGVVSEMFGVAPDRILGGVKKRFMAKGEKVVRGNVDAFNAGRQAGHAQAGRFAVTPLSYAPGQPKIIMDGNEAAGAGAIFAGCDLYAGYPITPSTEIMEWLARELPKFDGTLVQAEDEIASLAILAGASFAGAKALSATSGPGFSLMTELLGMCTMAELPVVVINVQRGGPSTGLPTKGEQADLFQAVFSANGDVVRPVLAPYSVATCFTAMVEAFNLAEEYQTPVIILSDQFIGQAKEAMDAIDVAKIEIKYRKTPSPEQLKRYQRFTITADNISPMAIPGTPLGQYLASGIEHDESGRPVSEAANHERMTLKRLRKLEPLRERRDLVHTIGDERAKIGILTWGSSTGPVQMAMAEAAKLGLATKAIVPQLICPIPVTAYQEFLGGVTKLLVVECSQLNQLYRYLRTEIDFHGIGVRLLGHAGGRSFKPAEVLAAIKEVGQ